jgi:hypothetical protein
MVIATIAYKIIVNILYSLLNLFLFPNQRKILRLMTFWEVLPFAVKDEFNELAN